MIIFNQKYDKERVEEELRSALMYSEYGIDADSERRLSQRAEYLTEKPQQAARIQHDELIGLECVQSYVSNMSTVDSLEELEYYEGITLPENLMGSSENEWTAPKWAKAGDVVFFMHTKTARSRLTALRSELNLKKNTMSQADYNSLMAYIDHALDIHSRYGGKIFAVGRVSGAPEYVQPDSFTDGLFHWKSRNYSEIDNIKVLDKPIDISEFREYIYISRGGSVTPLFDNEFDRLRKDISRNNQLPAYVTNAVARPVPLRKINRYNWLEVANDYRRCFILEHQFRKFYVDYFVKSIGDRKKYYVECRCQRSDINDSFMDYVMLFDGKYLPVEVKLSVSAEPNIVGQVSKYVFNSQVYLNTDGKSVSGNDFHPGKVLIIDTESLYMFDMTSGTVDKIYDLDNIRRLQDLEKVKRIIISKLH